jgi:hypothetical protein
VPEPADPTADAAPRSLPVPARPRTIERPPPASGPAAAAAATGGFLLGVATFVIVRVLRRPRRPTRRPTIRRGGRGVERLEVAATRSFLVDIHLLERR